MLTLVFGSILPIFGLIGLGYGCARADLLGEHAFEVLNRFVLKLSLPVLTFHILATVAPADLAVPSMIAAVLGGSTFVYILSFAIDRMAGRSAADANIIALSASYGNAAFVGLPICVVALGSGSLPPAALVIAVNASVVFGAALVIGEVLVSRECGLGDALRSAVSALGRNPLVLSCVLGVAWSLARLPLPAPLDTFTRTLGQATAPCALVAIGLFIARSPLGGGETLTILRALGLKLAVQPVVTLGLLLMLPPLPLVWAKTAVLMAAMPTGTSSFMLASGFGRGALNISARVIVISTVVSLLTLTGALALLSGIGRH